MKETERPDCRKAIIPGGAGEAEKMETPGASGEVEKREISGPLRKRAQNPPPERTANRISGNRKNG